MKKLTKLLLVTSGTLAVIAGINHLIFSLARDKNEDRFTYYKWKYGNIRYIVKGSGEPILLVHDVDMGSSLAEWKETIEELSKDYKVYAIDLLGFGASEKANISYSAYLYINLINDFVRDIIGKQVYFAGRGISGSYGAMAYYFEPELYKKMLLIAPTGIGSVNNSPQGKNVWLRWLLESPIIGTGIYNVLSSRCYLRWVLKEHYYENKNKVTDQMVEEIYLYAHKNGSGTKCPIASLLNYYLNVSIVHVLPNFNIPLHIIWGDNNQLNPIYNYLEIEKLKPDTALTIFEGSKIMPHTEKNDEFCNVLREFLKK